MGTPVAELDRSPAFESRRARPLFVAGLQRDCSGNREGRSTGRPWLWRGGRASPSYARRFHRTSGWEPSGRLGTGCSCQRRLRRPWPHPLSLETRWTASVLLSGRLIARSNFRIIRGLMSNREDITGAGGTAISRSLIRQMTQFMVIPAVSDLSLTCTSLSPARGPRELMLLLGPFDDGRFWPGSNRRRSANGCADPRRSSRSRGSCRVTPSAWDSPPASTR